MLQGKIPSEVVSKRQQYLNSLKKFVEEQKGKLQDALDQLGLNLPHLLEVESKQVCPYNKNHVVPEKMFKRHTETCRLLSAGCQKDELESQLQDLDFVYKDANSVMKVDIDEKTLNKVIWDSCVQNGQGHRRMPRNHIEENVELTQEDRLVLYQYVVKKSHEAGKVLPVDRNDDLLTTDWGSLVKKGLLDEQNNKEYGSKLEQLAALRDMKRRRQSYRAKNVHITKKSYTEIIREVIVNQMEILVPSGLQESTEDNTRLRSQADAVESQSHWSRDNSGSRHSRHGKDRASSRDRDERRHKNSRRSRSRDRHPRESSRRVDSRSNSSVWPRYGDPVDDNLPQSAIKVEVDEGRDLKYDDSYHTSKDAESLGVFSRKRSLSSSSNESSDAAKKSKKSKHKKSKHSKKHKRRN